jgi:hypothetical protein
MSTTLYLELIEYIFSYCNKFMNENEGKANWHHFAKEKSGHGKKESFYTHLKQKNLLSHDSEVLILLADGFQSFKERVAIRIYKEYENELNLNLCPKCLKIARTPLAKQCRFCFYDWHF